MMQTSMGGSDHAGAVGGLGVLSFDGMGLYEQPRPRLIFKMPRVVPDQKAKFETDELFRRLSRESEVRYTGYRDRPLEERQVRFQTGCREGHTEIAFAATGTNLQLLFAPPTSGFVGNPRECDFDEEHGKVHLRSYLIMNGVCVRWRGWLDLERLDGVGCLELDEERAAQEDEVLRDQIERYNQRLRDFEEKRRAYRTGAAQASHLNHHHHHGHHVHHVSTGGAPSVEPQLTHRQDPEMELRLGMQHQYQHQHQHQHQQQQQQAAAVRCHTGLSQRHPGLQPNLQARKKNDLSHGLHN